MPTGTTRIAVCQLQCHPALTIADFNYLAELLLPSDRSLSLANLSRHSLDVAAIQKECEAKYTTWHAARVQAALQYLASFEKAPDLVVFSEASIPLVLLPALREFATIHNATVFAGTHALQLTHQSGQRYKELGVKSTTHKSWGEKPRACTAILPIFNGDRSHFHRKRVPSVFEFTDVTPLEREGYELTPLTLEIGGQKIRVLPVVCAEALQHYTVPGAYDLAVACTFNTDVVPFDPFINHHVPNRIPVVLCNDGHYGGSGIHVPIDRRMNIWWHDQSHGRLPPGDSILIADVEWDHLAPQVGVTDPKPAFRLVSVAAMAYQDGKDDAFDAARTIASISLRADNSTQHELLTQVTAKRLSAVQRMKVAMLLRLSKQGTADQNWWNALGKDCIVGNQPDLARLEAGLAGAAAETLTRVLQSGTVTDIAALGTIAKCLNTCRSAAGHHSAPPVVRAQGDAIIDRDSDADSVVEFLERSREVVCLVVGLDAVGKSSVIRKALAQAGHRNVQSIPLAPDITPEFLAVRLLTAVDYPFANEADDPVAVLGEALPGRLARSSVWIIEDAGNLLSHVTWRDDRFTEVLRDLVRAAADAQAKIIVESNVSLDFPLDDPNQLKRVPIRGLAGEYAFGLLNQQLRRAGLEPGHYAQADRARIVEALGGHPGAIILAAEYVEKAGIEQVVKDITAREGVHAAIVRKIIRRLHLTEEEARVLALLAQARAPIPASVIAQVTSFNPMPVLQDLRKLALVERYENDRVAITGLLRGFGELPPPPPKDIEAFHLAAAIAFKKLSETADPSERLGWAVEARYHALTAGKPELAPDVGNLADGALGALSNFVDRNAYEAALPLADELLIFHRTAEVLELAAIVYSRLGKCEDALVLAKEAVAQQPHRAWILTEVGRLSLNVHKVEVAEDALRLAKATGTDSTFIAVLEGKVALRKRDIEAAIAAFRRGVVMSQYDGWPHFYLGRTLIEQGRVQEAVEVLHTGDSVENNRRHSRRNVLAAIRTQLVLAYLHMDDLCNAERWLGVVADEDPGSPEVARAFAYLRVKQGDPDVARKALQDLDPSRARNRHERAQIHLFRGLFFVGMGLRERASEEFNQSNLADSQNVFVLLRWAETLLEMAREAGAELEHEAARICAERAREVAGKVLEFDADNSQALAILELLYDLFNVG